VLTGVATLVTKRPALVVAGAAVLAVVALVFGANVAKHLGPFGFDDPATESVRAREAVERAAGYDPDLVLTAIVRPFTRTNVERTVARLRAEPVTARVLSVYSTGDRTMVSRDGRATFVVALFKPLDDRVRDRAAKRIEKQFAHDSTVELGGGVIGYEQVGRTVEDDLLRAETIAFPLLILLSFWVFRGLVAALLPPLVGALTILLAFLGLRLATGVTSLSVFALNLVTGMGLGLSIDWSLLVVSRFREELAASREGAVARTIASAGRTVVFSSLTVAAAMASLLVFPQRFLLSMGVGGVLVSLVGGMVALIVLPAVLGLLGPRVNALAPRRWRRADEGEGWYSLARFVMRHALVVAVASASFLLLLGVPFLRVTFTAADARVLPESASARQVYEQLARDFTRPTVPFYAVLRGRRADVAEFATHISALRGSPRVVPPRELAPGVWRLDVYGSRDYLSGGSQKLVREIRALPTPLDVLVGGGSAGFADEKSSLADHLPAAIALVIVTTLLVLFLMTGSLILPLKALVMNALTVSAAFGFLVFVFQDGRVRGLLRYPEATGIDFTQPILLFAVAFALSTDYGVFLLARIKEFHDAGATNEEAVARGLQRTGRIITAAALLFCAAVWTFATSRIVFVKQLGIGIGFAVLVDATLVRALLVPSLMRLLGDWNWWAPGPLRRLHARLGLSEVHGGSR
jgi:putative drug exporter of the RND superfamily